MKRGSLQYKILLIIMAGVALGLSPSPRAHYRIYRDLGRELGGNKDLNEWSETRVRQSLYRINRNEYMRKRIIRKGRNKFSIIFELTSKGKAVIKNYQKRHLINSLHISPPTAWDGKWRFVIFDIPEKHRIARDVLRDKLKSMDFFQIQQSVWAHPYPCKQEIELLAEYYALTDKIFIFEDIITNDAKLRAYFTRKHINLSLNKNNNLRAI